MQTDKELFDLIKNTYPLNPSEDFVSTTSNILKKRARKLNRKSRIKYLSFVTSGLALCTFAFSWFFFYGGKDDVLNNLNTHGEEKSLISVAEQEPLIYIYQSHNLESFFTETQTKDANEAFHETQNITLVGERLSQSLKERGINAIHDKTNITEILNENNFSFSETYSVSREPLNATLENNKSIKMVFDIHRDSRKRKDTTVKLKGIDYSKVVFLVSGSSSNSKENIKFAERLHNRMVEKYPRLSRGVIVTDNQDKQNTYNQDLLDNSVLLEIGGVENTLQEEYRTADILAEIIQDILNES
ncbi:stage II sporulation protein P [Cytobacillus eiseniae]|uniref:Stage II sporulation protein P n=1 Tax=Cytobacillus eiseniae TaxID=762947 RepID=A0ABS4RJ30_9BACI|nr:stage II sporulation protein P [Cytobacillus eiseniae]MBP2242902.1 stage II sporulation protein P [Cytobacillus eiseniae]